MSLRLEVFNIYTTDTVQNAVVFRFVGVFLIDVIIKQQIN